MLPSSAQSRSLSSAIDDLCLEISYAMRNSCTFALFKHIALTFTLAYCISTQAGLAAVKASHFTGDQNVIPQFRSTSPISGVSSGLSKPPCESEEVELEDVSHCCLYRKACQARFKRKVEAEPIKPRLFPSAIHDEREL